MIYIQRLGNGYRETVDACETIKEARILIHEYQTADPAGYYYQSSRACKNWET